MLNQIAVIGKILKLSKIQDADNILSAEVVCGESGIWQGVVNKNIFKEGDMCEVYLNDCILPKIDRFHFMEKHKHRITMKRFKGAPSEVLIMPIENEYNQYKIGDDISIEKKCIKYFKPIPANMSGDVYGRFPSFISKTDEINFQSVPEMINLLHGNPYYITEKADGSSATIYKYNNHFGCCSRNLELKSDYNNAIWKIARKYDLIDKLEDGYALQFEVVGCGIQKNPMKINDVEPRLFDVQIIKEHRYASYFELIEFSKKLNFPMVKVLREGDSFDNYSKEELLRLAEGLYDCGNEREGIVIRGKNLINGKRISFKVLNLNY